MGRELEKMGENRRERERTRENGREGLSVGKAVPSCRRMITMLGAQQSPQENRKRSVVPSNIVLVLPGLTLEHFEPIGS